MRPLGGLPCIVAIGCNSVSKKPAVDSELSTNDAEAVKPAEAKVPISNIVEAKEEFSARRRSILSRRLALHVAYSIVSHKLIRTILDREGFDVFLVNNAQEAVEEFKKQSFDVVVMNNLMPTMDGLEATRLMRLHELESGGHTPIIAVTAALDRDSCMSAGMDAYLKTPCRGSDLVEVLRQVCPDGM